MAETPQAFEAPTEVLELLPIPDSKSKTDEEIETEKKEKEATLRKGFIEATLGLFGDGDEKKVVQIWLKAEIETEVQVKFTEDEDQISVALEITDFFKKTLAHFRILSKKRKENKQKQQSTEAILEDLKKREGTNINGRGYDFYDLDNGIIDDDLKKYLGDKAKRLSQVKQMLSPRKEQYNENEKQREKQKKEAVTLWKTFKIPQENEYTETVFPLINSWKKASSISKTRPLTKEERQEIKSQNDVITVTTTCINIARKTKELTQRGTKEEIQDLLQEIEELQTEFLRAKNNCSNEQVSSMLTSLNELDIENKKGMLNTSLNELLKQEQLKEAQKEQQKHTRSMILKILVALAAGATLGPLVYEGVANSKEEKDRQEELAEKRNAKREEERRMLYENFSLDYYHSFTSVKERNQYLETILQTEYAKYPNPRTWQEAVDLVQKSIDTKLAHLENDDFNSVMGLGMGYLIKDLLETHDIAQNAIFSMSSSMIKEIRTEANAAPTVTEYSQEEINRVRNYGPIFEPDDKVNRVTLNRNEAALFKKTYPDIKSLDEGFKEDYENMVSLHADNPNIYFDERYKNWLKSVVIYESRGKVLLELVSRASISDISMASKYADQVIAQIAKKFGVENTLNTKKEWLIFGIKNETLKKNINSSNLYSCPILKEKKAQYKEWIYKEFKENLKTSIYPRDNLSLLLKIAGDIAKIDILKKEKELLLEHWYPRVITEIYTELELPVPHKDKAILKNGRISFVPYPIAETHSGHFISQTDVSSKNEARVKIFHFIDSTHTGQEIQKENTDLTFIVETMTNEILWNNYAFLKPSDQQELWESVTAPHALEYSSMTSEKSMEKIAQIFSRIIMPNKMKSFLIRDLKTQNLFSAFCNVETRKQSPNEGAAHIKAIGIDEHGNITYELMNGEKGTAHPRG